MSAVLELTGGLPGHVPVPEDVAIRYRRAAHWRPATLSQRYDESAERSPGATALVAGGERFTYAQLRTRSEAVAAGLRQLGIRRRDRVVVQLPNIADFVDLCLGLLRLGAIPVMALPAHRQTEIRHLVALSGAVGLVVPAELRGFNHEAMAHAVRSEVASLQHVVVAADVSAPGRITLAQLRQAEMAGKGSGTASGPDPRDVAILLLSGGTTGLPKLIPRTHEDYAYNARISAEICRLDTSAVYLATLPISHNFPLGCPGLLGTLFAGGRVVLSPSPDPETAFGLIESERVTCTAVVPAVAMRWMDSPLRERCDLSSLRLLQVGGARLNPEAARRVAPLLGCTLQQVFGMAEGLLNYTRLDDPEDVIVETQGRPASPDDEIRVVDEDEHDVAPGEPGNLLARGPYTIRGYFRAEEHNQRAFTADGYYRTGDVVRLHPSGNLIVEGREKDLINRGGEKISAEEVENLLLGHPAVFNVAAVAMPDAVLGERICAYVVLRDGASLVLDELDTYMESRQVARFKRPERLVLVDSLPLTNVGKIDKKALRGDIAARIAAEAQAAGGS